MCQILSCEYTTLSDSDFPYTNSLYCVYMFKQSIEVRFIALTGSLTHSAPLTLYYTHRYFFPFLSCLAHSLAGLFCRFYSTKIETQDRGRKVSNKNHIKNNTYSLMQQNKLFIIIFIATSKKIV